MTANTALARFPSFKILAPFAFALVLTLAALPGRALAGDPASDAQAFLQSFSEQAVATLANASLSDRERDTTLKSLLINGFEMKTIGRLALGRHWKRANDSQRSEYSDLFETYVTSATIKRLSGYSGEVLELGKARTAGKSELVSIPSQIRSPNGSSINVEWRLRHTAESDWRIIDVVIEGVSMLQTHRAEFDAVIRQGGSGLDGLLAKLRSIVQPDTAQTAQVE